MATVVTRKGREIIVNMMRATGTEPKVVGWGLNPAALTAANTDVMPFAEASEARVTGTSTVQTTTTANDTYQVVGTITAGGNKTIGEVFLSDSATQPTQNTLAAAGSQSGGNFTAFNAGGTTLVFASSFSPGNGNYFQCRSEVMQCSAGSGTASLTVVRAQNGSASGTTFAAADVATPGNIPNTTATTGGSMYLHGDFTGLALLTNDSIQFTIKVSHA